LAAVAMSVVITMTNDFGWADAYFAAAFLPAEIGDEVTISLSVIKL
jgi:hypothetical protein